MAEFFDRGHALVIGVGADLPVTETDARGLADLLRDPARCAYPQGQVTLLTGSSATRVAILDSLDALAQAAAPETTTLVYFSGHGLELPDYYLIPFGCDPGNLISTAISGAEFTTRLGAIRSQKLLVLLDCCHAGGQAEAAAKEVPGLKSPLPPGAIVELERGQGRVVIASSRRDELSWTGHPYSVFTGALLEALAGYGSFERDGYARVLDAALWVGRQVPERTKDRQHPIIKASHLENNFALAYYAAGDIQPKKLDWASRPPLITSTADAGQITAWQRMLANYRENLLLIEERMSEYVEFAAIPLQLIKSKRRVEAQIAELEQRLGLAPREL
jgi:uncharacterized caspase-like protein